MRFRNGHISGFIDELTDSLFDTPSRSNQSDLLQEYHEEVSIGPDDIDSVIPIPTLFVFLSDTTYTVEDPSTGSGSFNVTTFTLEDNIALRDELLKYMNEAAGNFNVKFFPAQKTSSTAQDLSTPGISLLEMKDQTSLKEYQTYDPTQGSITISQYHNYLQHGVAIASNKAMPNGSVLPVRGIPHQDISERIKDELSVDFSKVYTVVLSHKLNTESMTDTEPGWAVMTCTHPATASEKHYLSFFSISHLRNSILDNLTHSKEDIVANYNATYPSNTPVDMADLNLLSAKLLIGHLIGNTFGLLPIGTPDLNSLITSNFADHTCQNSNGCILLGGNGNCIDIAPLVVDDYFSEYLTLTPWMWTSEDVCSEDITIYPSGIPLYQSVSNYMNFWNIEATSMAQFFSNSQINYIRAGFETSGTILKSLKDNAANFISTQDNNEVYCSNYQPTYEARPLKLDFKNIQESQSEEALNFEKVKSKIVSICNKLIYR